MGKPLEVWPTPLSKLNHSDSLLAEVCPPAPLEASDEPLLLSADSLKQWSRCKQQFLYKTVKGLRWPSSPANFAFGTQVHKLLDYASREGLPYQPLLAHCSPEVKQAFQLLHQSPLGQAPIIASEWAFTVPILVEEGKRPVWLQGRVDRLAEWDNGLAIIDWKTGTAIPRDPATAWQTLAYCYGVYEARDQLGLNDLAADHLSFIYLQVKGTILKEVRLPYSASQHQQVKKRLAELASNILEERLFALPPSCPDRFCPYASLCGIETLSLTG